MTDSNIQSQALRRLQATNRACRGTGTYHDPPIYDKILMRKPWGHAGIFLVLFRCRHRNRRSKEANIEALLQDLLLNVLSLCKDVLKLLGGFDKVLGTVFALL